MKEKLITSALFSCVAFALPLSLLAETRYDGSDTTIDGKTKSSAQSSERGESMDSDQRRFRMRSDSQTEITQDDRDEIRDVLFEAVNSAVAGDSEDMIDYLARSDRERLESQTEPNQEMLENASEAFNSAWESSHDDSFSDSFDRNSLKVDFVRGNDDKTALVRVSDGDRAYELKLLNEGTVMDAWRIDAPDTLTRQELQKRLELALSDRSSGNAPSDKVAIKVLSCLGQPISGDTRKL